MSKPIVTGNRMIQVRDGVIGPREPRTKNVKIKSVNDYPGVSKAHLELHSCTRIRGSVAASPYVMNPLL